MRTTLVLYKNEEAGILSHNDDNTYTFAYLDVWFSAPHKPPINLTFPKAQKEFHSKFLFPFFYNMLPEGSNKLMICRQHRIDENDYFSLLLATAQYDTIGAVTLVPK